MQLRIKICFALACLTMLAGCGIRPGDADLGSADFFGTVQLFGADDQPITVPPGATIAATGTPFAAQGKAIDVLALSGGGSIGAFGAGVMKGWTQSGKRPTFDVVTGVSTGGLIASFAFLGPNWDGKLEEFYTQTENSEIYQRRGLRGLFGDGLLDTAPLRHQIDNAVDMNFINSVAEEHRKGRRLYVATTDLDAGEAVVWDMGGIAASDNPNRLQLYRDVLVASAAVPGLFRPVYVRSQTEPEKMRMHVDGGVKTPVLLRSFMIAGKQKQKTVWMLLNGALKLRAEGAQVKANLPSISMRSISELLRGLTYKTVYQSYVATRQAGADYRLLFLPDEEKEPNAFEFEEGEMRKLFEIGRRLGADPANWRSEPPRLEQFERLNRTAPRSAPSRSRRAA